MQPVAPPRKAYGSTGRYVGPEYDHGPLPDVAGRVLELCGTQDGCRYLQRVVETGTAEDVLLVFRSVIADLPALMCDSLANYICQKLFEHCGERQHLAAIQTLARDVVEVARNVHGTRALQKLIDTLTTAAEMGAMRDVLLPHVFLLVQDGNGNHVVQRVMHDFPQEYNQFVYDILTNDALVEKISMHRHGCCVMQRALDHACEAQKTLMVAKVVEHSFPLVRDAYGNYVVQYVLEMPLPGIATRFTRTLRGRFIELAKQKFSSNVVEKIMNKGEKDALDAILDEIIACRDMAVLLQDPYANYVVQTALVTANDAQHRQLVALIVPHLALLRNTVYGKRIMAKLYREPAPGTAALAPGSTAPQPSPLAAGARHSAPPEGAHSGPSAHGTPHGNPRGSPVVERRRIYHPRQ